VKKVTKLSHQHQPSLPLSPQAKPTVGTVWRSAGSPFKLRPMKVRQIGFTLIELLITVAIAAILLALAAPNFREMLVKRSVQAAASNSDGHVSVSRRSKVRNCRG
jgi:prepilin-type N-terminal cleavage/methylation domain-containing protein